MACKSRPPKEGKTPAALKPRLVKVVKSRAKPGIATHKSRYLERVEKWAAQVSKTKALILGTPTTAKRIAKTTFANTDCERKPHKRSSGFDVLEPKSSAKVAKSKKGTSTKVVRSNKSTPARLGIKGFQKAVVNLSLKNKLSGRSNGQAPRKIRKLKKVSAALSAQRAKECLASIASELEELESGYMRIMKTPKHLAAIVQRNNTLSTLPRLPGEIRNRIWEFASSDGPAIEITDSTGDNGQPIFYETPVQPKDTDTPPASYFTFCLPQVCRQTYTETATLGFSATTFIFPCSMCSDDDCVSRMKYWKTWTRPAAYGNAVTSIRPSTHIIEEACSNLNRHRFKDMDYGEWEEWIRGKILGREGDGVEVVFL